MRGFYQAPPHVAIRKQKWLQFASHFQATTGGSPNALRAVPVASRRCPCLQSRAPKYREIQRGHRLQGHVTQSSSIRVRHLLQRKVREADRLCHLHGAFQTGHRHRAHTHLSPLLPPFMHKTMVHKQRGRGELARMLVEAGGIREALPYVQLKCDH